MSHGLILGQTESGKSSIAKALCGYFGGTDIPIGVYDPMYDPGFEVLADFWTADVDLFLDYAYSHEGCILFIDEVAEIKKSDPRLMKLVTRGRHWGHSVFLMCHRLQQIDVTTRNQASMLFLFNSDRSDGEKLAKAWNEPALVECATLGTGECLFKARLQPVKKIKLF